MVVGHILRAKGRVPFSSFVFEWTFSCLTFLPYSPENSRITASRFVSSSLEPVPLIVTDCFSIAHKTLRKLHTQLAITDSTLSTDSPHNPDTVKSPKAY